MVARPPRATCSRIVPPEGFVLDLSRLLVDDERQVTSTQQLTDQDMVDEKGIVLLVDVEHLVLELRCPSEVSAAVEESVIEEPLRHQHLALEILYQVEEEIALLEPVATWADPEGTMSSLAASR